MNTGAREDVLAFYRKLPFNSNEKPEVAANLIRKINNVEYIYPSIADFYYAEDFLEIGCGAGWLSNSVAYYYGLSVTAIDFNSDAIESARKTAEILGGGILNLNVLICLNLNVNQRILWYQLVYYTIPRTVREG